MEADSSICCDVNHGEHEQFEIKTGRWDKAGLFLSTLCAVHCLVTPLLVLSLPVLGSIFESHWAHLLMALFVLPVGLYAFWSGYLHHRQLNVFLLGVLGLLLIVGGSVLPHEWIEVFEFDVVTILGSVLLISAHLLNRRACLCHKHAPEV